MKSDKRERIEAELRQIQAADLQGLLKGEAVVEFAKNPDTALHGEFKWDDEAEAHQWRLHVARGIIRRYVAVISDDKPQKVRAFVSLSSDRVRAGGGYRAIAQVLSKDDLRKEFIADIYRFMKRSMAKYGEIQEVSEVFAAMEAALMKPAAATG